MDKVRKVLIRNGKQYFWKAGDLHTDAGMVKEDELKKDDSYVESQLGKGFTMFPASFLDKVNRMKRGPQTLLPKDLAIISYYSGIDRNSRVVDAGTGCGLLAIVLSRIAKEVTTYEREEKNIEIAKHNIELLDAENVTIKNKDIYEGIDETGLDLITLDLPEPWRALEHAKKALKAGAYIITYLPSITQVMDLVNEADRQGLLVDRTIEILEREWHVEGKKVRPSSDMYGHTAFLTIIRKI